MRLNPIPEGSQTLGKANNPQSPICNPQSKKLSFLGLAATVFFCVSGGPIGLEPVLQSGAWLGLLLIAVAPFVWAAPIALMTAELSTAMPVEGGYYVWVREAMGPFAGFLCAWWSWVYSWLDTALYPTLFFAYLGAMSRQLGFDHGEGSPWTKWLFGLVLIVPLTYLNIRGARLTGKWSFAFAILLMIPFVAMVLIGLPYAASHPPSGFLDPGKAIGPALFVVMWNYLGADMMSTVAAEVENPKRAYPRALAWALPLTAACYLLPAFVGLARFRIGDQWTDGAWTGVGAAIGGRTLASAITIAGVLSSAGMFASDLLSASRLPFALSIDGYLPAEIRRLHPRFGTPVVAILISAAFYTAFSYDSFQELAKADVVLYSAALILEMAALVVLRIKQPGLERPYRIPGGLPGVLLVALVPTALVLVALGFLLKDQDRGSIATCAVGVASAFVAYPICRQIRARTRSSVESDLTV